MQVPLLVGKILFGRTSQKYILLCRQELLNRKAASIEETIGVRIRSLIAIVQQDEYPLFASKEEVELSDEESRELKYFYPVCLTYEYYSDDMLDTVQKNL